MHVSASSGKAPANFKIPAFIFPDLEREIRNLAHYQVLPTWGGFRWGKTQNLSLPVKKSKTLFKS
jgi:hypothetical protein